MRAAPLAALVPLAAALDNGAARTPPMGFNSYMAGVSGEKGLGSIADFFVSSGLRDKGFVYVNTDEGWEQKNRDASGKLQWSGGAYPSGLPTFIKSLNAKGLKYGIYGAASGVTCGNNPGQLYHEDIDAQTYADWGVEYLKSDNCASYALDPSVRFGAMRDALNRTGKRIVLSIEAFSITPDEEQSVRVSNLNRVACDISGRWGTILDRADISDKWAPLARPGYWNDPDMINLQAPAAEGVHDVGASSGAFTLGENRVYFGLWAVMKSPLILSANLPRLPAGVIDIVNSSGVIAVNQDPLGVQARKLAVDGKPLPWLIGVEDCRGQAAGYSRALQKATETDTRVWELSRVGAAAAAPRGANFDGPFRGIPTPAQANRRCGTCCGASDTTSATCNGTTSDGRLYISIAEMEARCAADAACVGFGVEPAGAPDGGGYVRPVTRIESADVADLWQTYCKPGKCSGTPVPPTGPPTPAPPTPVPAPPPALEAYTIRNPTTGRCLALSGGGAALLPCNSSDASQHWAFGKGATTVSSVVSVQSGQALALTNTSLHAHAYSGDAYPVPDAAYGHSGLRLVAPYDQAGCSSRDCQNYDPSQMWYYDRPQRLLRHSTYVASMNHKDSGEGYTLTHKVPTWRHHCLAHVLSDGNAGTASGETEVWGGPLSGGAYVIALLNRGTAAATIAARWSMLEVAGVGDETTGAVRDLWAGRDLAAAKGGFSASVAGHDIGIYKVTIPHPTNR